MWDVMVLMIGEVAIPYDSKEEPMMKTILYTIFIPIEKNLSKKTKNLKSLTYIL